MAAQQAKLFSTGGSQAVRLPAEFRFQGTDVVYIRRNAAGEVVLSPHPPQRYAEFLAARQALGVAPADFLSPEERRQQSETRDPFGAT